MFMKKSLAVTLIAFFVVGCLAVYPSESAAEQKVLKYGYLSPPFFAMGRNAKFFKNYVEKRTGGAIKIELYPLSQLGGARAMLDSILAGTLEICSVPHTVAATLMPEFNVLCLPFVVPNSDVMWKILWTKDFSGKLDNAIRKKGIVPIFISDVAGRGFLNTKRVVRRPKDIKGMRMRVMQGTIYTDMFKAMGAKTRTMPFPEVYTALQQGLIDGEDNTLEMAVAMKFVEIEKYFTPLNHTMIVLYILGSGKMWNSLTKEQQKIFIEARDIVEKFAKEAMELDVCQGVGKAKEKYRVNVGKPLTPEELAEFRKVVKPVLAKYRDVIGADVYDQFIELANKYEKKLGKK